MSNIIELKNVNKIYGKRIKCNVLSDVSLSIERGSFNSIIGASGSGKTTLLNIISTLDRPTNGQVFIDGIPTDKMRRGALTSLRNKKIGFIFQFHYLLPEFNVMENVLMPHTINSFFHGKAGVLRADELLELVGLNGMGKKKICDLSGGQQQRVAIARALMNKPQIVLADEPTGNLDSGNTLDIYQLFRNINKNFGTTFIIVTHDEKIAYNADKVFKIRDGKVDIRYQITENRE